MIHINGKMRVTLIGITDNADKLLVFSKRTRHSVSLESFEEVQGMSIEEIDQELDYVFSTIGSSWEFVDYVFLLEGVTRAFTHQLVRHRVGVAFAQQAMRVGEQSDFGYMMNNDIYEDRHKREVYIRIMDQIQTGYNELMALGARPQDARGVLPTNILTNILFKVNLRAFADASNVRLCIRAQGEFQRVARLMQAQIISHHPWASRIIGPECLVKGICKFPRYDKCPISQSYPELRGLPEKTAEGIRKLFLQHTGYDPQPERSDWNLEGLSGHIASHSTEEIETKKD